MRWDICSSFLHFLHGLDKLLNVEKKVEKLLLTTILLSRQKFSEILVHG